MEMVVAVRVGDSQNDVGSMSKWGIDGVGRTGK